MPSTVADRNDDGLVTLREFLNGSGDDQGAALPHLDRNRDGFAVAQRVARQRDRVHACATATATDA